MAAQLQGLSQPSAAALRAHVESVRLFTRDFAELNLLIRGEESSDRMITWATLDFLSDFNGTPPFSGFTLDDIWGYNLQNLAVRGTTISLIQSLMIIYNRNYLSFSDGGINTVMNDKAPMLRSMLDFLTSAYEQNKRQVKTAINVNSILDIAPSGVHSDYLALSNTGYI